MPASPLAPTVECDVLVVGSGAAGGSAARELAEQGLSVLVLEAGRAVGPQDMLGASGRKPAGVDFLGRVKAMLFGQPIQARVAFQSALSAYSVSKTALIRLSECLALESKPYNVCVFAIDPGTVRTPMTEAALSSESVKQAAPEVQGWFRYLFDNRLDTPLERPVQAVERVSQGLCGASRTLGELVAARTLQGLGASAQQVLQSVEALKRRGARIFYYIAPQAWANWARAGDQVDTSRASARLSMLRTEPMISGPIRGK